MDAWLMPVVSGVWTSVDCRPSVFLYLFQVSIPWDSCAHSAVLSV